MSEAPPPEPPPPADPLAAGVRPRRRAAPQRRSRAVSAPTPPACSGASPRSTRAIDRDAASTRAVRSSAPRPARRPRLPGRTTSPLPSPRARAGVGPRPRRGRRGPALVHAVSLAGPRQRPAARRHRPRPRLAGDPRGVPAPRSALARGGAAADGQARAAVPGRPVAQVAAELVRRRRRARRRPGGRRSRRAPTTCRRRSRRDRARARPPRRHGRVPAHRRHPRAAQEPPPALRRLSRSARPRLAEPVAPGGRRPAGLGGAAGAAPRGRRLRRSASATPPSPGLYAQGASASPTCRSWRDSGCRSSRRCGSGPGRREPGPERRLAQRYEVDPLDVDSIAEGLVPRSSDETLRARLSEGGQVRAAALHLAGDGGGPRRCGGASPAAGGEHRRSRRRPGRGIRPPRPCRPRRLRGAGRAYRRGAVHGRARRRPRRRERRRARRSCLPALGHGALAGAGGVAPGSVARRPDSRPARLVYGELGLGPSCGALGPAVGGLPRPALHDARRRGLARRGHGPRPHLRSTTRSGTSAPRSLFFRRALAPSPPRRAAAIDLRERARRPTSMRQHLPPRGPVHVVPHGVDHGRFAPTSRSRRRRGGARPARAALRPTCSTSGRSSPGRTFPASSRRSTAWRRHGPELSLVLAGQGRVGRRGRRRGARRRPAPRASSGDSATSPGGDVPALLRRAAAVAYPSFDEGFGLPALEALACGAPLVTTARTARWPSSPGRRRCWSTPGDPGRARRSRSRSCLGGGPAVEARRRRWGSRSPRGTPGSARPPATCASGTRPTSAGRLA